MAKKKNTPEEFKLVEKKLCELGFKHNYRGTSYEYTKTLRYVAAIVTFRLNYSNGSIKDVSAEMFFNEQYRRTDDGSSTHLMVRATSLASTKMPTPEDMVAVDRKLASFDEYVTKVRTDVCNMINTVFNEIPEPQNGIKTGLVDINNREIKIGDKIKFCYVDPMGHCNPDSFSDLVHTVAFEQGCVVGVHPERNAKILRGYMKTAEGKYISNYGNLVEYPDNVVYCKVID